MPSYLLYFEINKKNIGQICSSLPHTKTWTGFDWTNANYITVGTCTQYDKNSTFPIKAYLNPLSSNKLIEKTDYVLSRDDLEIKDNNSFFLWDEVQGTTDFNYRCQCSSVEVQMTSGTSTSFNDTCKGTECQTWFPPLGNPTPKTADSLFKNAGNQIACYTSNPTSGEPKLSGVINQANIVYSFPIYKPISYTSVPDVNQNNEYIPNPSIKGAFYNCSPFNGVLQLINGNMQNDGIVNAVCSCETVPPNDKDSYAIYEVRYDIPVSSLSKSNFSNQLNDFLYIQQYLYLNSTSSFLESEYMKVSIENIKQLIIDYCDASSNMTDSLCSKTFSDFIFLNSGSPCVNPYSLCSKGWDNYCFQKKNIFSDICLNYFSNSYNTSTDPNDKNLLLNNNVTAGLQKTCQSLYKDAKNPTTDLSQDFWNVCSCFLPNQYYEEYIKENNFQELSLGTQQCWYLPCSGASVLPENNPSCPNNSVSNCIQDEYITIKSNNPANIKNNIIQTNQTINSCGSKTVEPIGTVTVDNVSNLPTPITTFIPQINLDSKGEERTTVPPIGKNQYGTKYKSLKKRKKTDLQQENPDKKTSKQEITTNSTKNILVGIFTPFVLLILFIILFNWSKEKKKKNKNIYVQNGNKRKNIYHLSGSK